MRLIPMMTAASLLLIAAQPLTAEAVTSGAISVDQGWASESIVTQPNSTAYVTIMNRGRMPDRLIGATTPAARSVGIFHNVTERRGVRTRLLPGGLLIPAGRTLELKPGGNMLMLTGLDRPLTQRTHVPVTLRFQRAGEVKVMLTIKKLGYQGPSTDI